jgi:hypothetical protein
MTRPRAADDFPAIRLTTSSAVNLSRLR